MLGVSETAADEGALEIAPDSDAATPVAPEPADPADAGAHGDVEPELAAPDWGEFDGNFERLQGSGSAAGPLKSTRILHMPSSLSGDSVARRFSPRSQSRAPCAREITSFHSIGTPRGKRVEALHCGKVSAEVASGKPSFGSQLPSASAEPTTRITSPGIVILQVVSKETSLVVAAPSLDTGKTQVELPRLAPTGSLWGLEGVDRGIEDGSSTQGGDDGGSDGSAASCGSRAGGGGGSGGGGASCGTGASCGAGTGSSTAVAADTDVVKLRCPKRGVLGSAGPAMPAASCRSGHCSHSTVLSCRTLMNL
mmetsp:Transcript_47750/g.153740  ORF Transcript_47750/g.153740 Transcript_47750/m.153740 type:complete len:309 (-) Transcript_47750:317-1243(-)